jgi:hypothetical protein
MIHDCLMNTYNAESGCCPRFSPEKWDDKEFVWDGKLFVKNRVCTFFYMPLNFGKVVVRMWEKIEAAGAMSPEPPVFLCDHTSKWSMDVYIEATKEVPGVENAKLSGTFMTKVYEGPYRDTGKWCEDMKKRIAAKGKTIEKMYMEYVYCPKCAKFYGKNYTVIFAKV